jgi:hypothetical protein
MDHVILDRETRVWMHNKRLSDDSQNHLWGTRIHIFRQTSSNDDTVPGRQVELLTAPNATMDLIAYVFLADAKHDGLQLAHHG